MNNDEFRKRIARLEVLARGLSIEADRERKGHFPLYIPERRQHVDGLHAAVQALNEARIALVGALHRLEKEAVHEGQVDGSCYFDSGQLGWQIAFWHESSQGLWPLKDCICHPTITL